MKNITATVEGKKGSEELVLRIKLNERHGLSNSGNTVTIAATPGNQRAGLGDIMFGLNVYTKEELAKHRLAAAKEAGYNTWEEYDKARKGTKAA